jgi:transposase-like protein
MAKANPKSAILQALRVATVDEQRAVEFMEKHRWGAEPACPRCGDVDVYMMRTRDGERNKDYRWRCRSCNRQFTVRTGTVMEESRLPLRVWVYAFWKACSNKKGCSALQLSREMEITHKSALFVLRRIRHGIGDPEPRRKLSDTVEADEVYVGGKPRVKGISKRGRGTSKTPVLGIVERGGNARFKVMQRLTAEDLEAAIEANVEASARLCTDELASYNRVGEKMKGGHEQVNHSSGEYVRPGTDVHSNTAESLFSLFRRGVMGSYHSISVKHLPNYLDEFAFRWDTRKVDDDERVHLAIRRVDGRRLEYRESVDMPPWQAAN